MKLNYKFKIVIRGEFMHKRLYSKINKLNGIQIVILGIIAINIIGAIILTLPVSSKSGEGTNFLDALFTSASAVCVNGLVINDTGTHWSTFGQIVLIILSEIGGLGIMSFTIFIAILLGKKITLKDRLTLQNSMNTFSIQGLVKMIKYIMYVAFSVQFFGILLLSTQFVPEFGIKKGMFYSLFHSVSAFCNVGMDLFGDFKSLTEYYSNPVIIITISILVIIGGLGFTVLIELYNYREIKNISVHTKMVLFISTILIILGALFIFILEYNNPKTLGDMSIFDKILNSIFASITPRTAGFNTISTEGMTKAGKIVTIMLMFIGGSPGSTAGGLKTSTFGIIVFTIISVIRGRDDTEAFGRRFSKEVVYKSFSLLIIGIMLVIAATMLLSITEYDETFISILYEATSAIGTAGLSTGVTQRLSGIGKVIIIVMMYIGRIGPFTLAFALTNNKKKTGIRYPEGRILIG